MPAEPLGGRDRPNPSSTSRSAPTAIRSSPAVRNSWIPRAVSSVSRRSSGRSPSPAGNSSRRRGERSPRLNLQPLSPFEPSRQRTAAPRADLAAILRPRRRSRCSTADRRRGCHSVSCPLSESLGGSEVAGPVLVKLGELILRKRLGWEKIQRAGCRLVEHRAQYRHVVAERLPRCRRRHDDDVSAGQRA